MSVPGAGAGPGPGPSFPASVRRRAGAQPRSAAGVPVAFEGSLAERSRRAAAGGCGVMPARASGAPFGLGLAFRRPPREGAPAAWPTGAFSVLGERGKALPVGAVLRGAGSAARWSFGPLAARGRLGEPLASRLFRAFASGA